jgi:HK97 family phage major capsid protein
MAKPNDGMKSEAKKGLDWREEFGRGGTRVGAVRARQIVANENLSDETIKRMFSFFSRHEVDKKAEGFRPGEEGYPSNGRIAWALWGGDAGYSWSKRLVEQMNEEKSMENKEDRHILNVTETDESVVVEYAKHHEAEEETEEVSEEIEDVVEEESYDEPEEERKVVDMPIRYRNIDLSRAKFIDEDTRTVRIGVSSEEPVERSFGLEILSHKAEDVNMEFINSGRAPLLLDHDMTKQIGVIEDFRLDETAKRTIAVVRFGKSRLASEVFEDVKDGIRMNISVGYRVNKLMRIKDSKEVAYRAAWSPMEVSSVSVPADQSRLVGVGRSQSFKEIKMDNEVNLDEVKAKSAEEVKAELKRNSQEIYKLAERHNQKDLAARAIAEHKTIEEFRGELLETIASKPLETPKDIGLSKKEMKRFSLVKGINALANPSDRAAQKAAEFEFECSAAAAEAYGRNSQGLMLPPEVLREWNQRDLNTSDDAGIVGQDFRGGDFIDALRNSSSVMSAGATLLRGLQGDVKIPKKTGTSTAAFVSSEGTAVAESEMTIGSVTMSPKTLGCFTDVTRQLLTQSSLDVENLIRNDIAQSMALAIDAGALEGSGTSGNPTGIKNTAGINTVTFAGANPTWAETVNMESQVAVDNALIGNLSYIMRADDYGTLKTTEKATGTAQFVVDRDGRVNNYGVVVSNQPTSGDHYFGNFSDLLVGFFGGLDIIVDPYTNSSSGTVRVVGIQMIDVAVRNAVSFCLGNDG